MPPVVVETDGVSVSYRSRVGRPRLRVLHDARLTVQEGTVHGLLGPNGAGKTTLLRTLVGLCFADEGRYSLFGQIQPRFGPADLTGVGALIESPRFVPSLSSVRNLFLRTGCPSKEVTDVLSRVGLNASAHRSAGTLSLGMRQRLALASALLTGSRLLILDEPMNGLDPDSIALVREIIVAFRDRGGTVLVSSHNLAEMQATADTVTIINDGVTVLAGPLNELLEADESSTAMRIECSHPEVLAHAIRDDHPGCQVRVSDDTVFVSGVTPSSIQQNLAKSLSRGVEIRRLEQSRQTLEDVYMTLRNCGKDARD